MVNTNKLKARIIERGMTQKEVMDIMGLTKRQFQIRLEKKSFNSDEIYQLLNILDIDDPRPIFFADAVTQ